MSDEHIDVIDRREQGRRLESVGGDPGPHPRTIQYSLHELPNRRFIIDDQHRHRRIHVRSLQPDTDRQSDRRSRLPTICRMSSSHRGL